MFCFCQFHWVGHIRAAEALQKFVVQKYPKSKTLIVDTFKYINPLIHTVVVDGYLNIVKYVPEIYGGFTECPTYKKHRQNEQGFSNLLTPKIHRLIQSFKPQL